MNDWNLKNKKALITGATKGIGRAVAVEFLNLGAEVMVIARNTEDLEEFKKQFSSVHILSADVAEQSHREKIAEFVKNTWNSLDILVNNAGTNIRKATVGYSIDEYRKVFEINMFSAFELCRLLHPFLKNSGNASVINIASTAGMTDVGTGTPYGMTKAALIQMSKNLAGEWAKDGIRVNTVSPWYTKTPLAQPVLDNPERLQLILSKTPLNRIAEPEEVAAAIAFLAMDKSSYITGQNIAVDGGMTIKGL